MSNLRRAFTLVEILVVLAVIAIMAALIFPALSRAREGGRQTRCTANLAQIYTAVRQYKDDEGQYPHSIAPMLPVGTTLVTSTGSLPPLWAGLPSMVLGTTLMDLGPGTSGEDALPGTTTGGGVTVISNNGRGYLKTFDVLRCPNDSTKALAKVSSYDTSGASVWNAWGYYFMGLAHSRVPSPAPASSLLVNPAVAYDAGRNPVAKSLANRFASPSTIITHCRFHRPQTSGLSSPDVLYTPQDNGTGTGARDIVLRLDGSIKATDVSTWAQTTGTPALSQWQLQN